MLRGNIFVNAPVDKYDADAPLFYIWNSNTNTVGADCNLVYTKTWGQTLDQQKSALRWDIKRTMNNLCKRLVDAGEECFVVTVNMANGWVGHMGSVRGNDYINEKSFICYDFLEFCQEHDDLDRETEKAQSEEKVQPNTKTQNDNRNGEDTDDSDEYEDDPLEEVDDDETMISISRAEAASSDEDMSGNSQSSLKDFYEKKRSNLQKWKSKQIIKKAKLRLKRTSSKTPQQQSSSTSTSSNVTRRTSPRKNKVSGNLYCDACERQFYYRNSYIWHLKSTSHVLKCQLMMCCFKCLEHFPDNKQMYAHIKTCDMIKHVSKLIDGD